MAGVEDYDPRAGGRQPIGRPGPRGARADNAYVVSRQRLLLFTEYTGGNLGLILADVETMLTGGRIPQ